MATFIVLSKFTDQGAKSLADFERNARANLERGEQLGITNKGVYLTQGRYDMVIVAEAPDAETILAMAAGVAGKGLMRPETLRAFTLEEAEKVLSRLG